ncbi:myeloid leukemia factor 1 isoform X3 [Tyto alba]|uniref:myeloid leukemia factor 1 isoform X3 n=1 Tax=Tyto alba TaxID=56313 RepID=UPI0014021EB8|nr:myeloid leukemia factor 1 isoform X3 [Tyto alba]
MFGGLGRCFEEDPFFRDPFAAHHEYMRQMMRSFSDPFGRDPFLSITDGGERTVDRRARQDSQVALRGNHRDDLSIHPDGHTFSSSSVMTYSKIGDEPPKVFQASAQTRTAPGGVKETRKALKDSESGLEKMAIGHHIHDRAHVIKKSKNSKTGDEEMNQEFINLDETEAQTFDEEWQKEIMKFKPSRTRGTLEAPKYRSIHHVPREDGLRRGKPLAVAGSGEPRVSSENLSVKGRHVPIKSSKK